VIFAGWPYRRVMVPILSAFVAIIAFRFRSRASLELKLMPFKHQLAVLRRRRPGSASAFIPGPAAVDVALSDLAADHRRDGGANAATAPAG
jgi:hypothetical protein